MSPEKLKHLEFIQNVTTRMNTNSFQIKSWMVTVVSAILVLYASTQKPLFIIVAIFPAVIFWFLDTYYLTQEKKFRGLYNDVAGISDEPKELKPFAMRPDLYKGGDYSFGNVFWSSTICRLYLPIIILLIGVYIYLKYCTQ